MLRASRKTTDVKKKIIETIRTPIGSTTVITRTITIGTIAKIAPIAGISRSIAESTGPWLKLGRRSRGHTGIGAIVIQTTITAANNFTSKK
jgi:hypothetical protein